MAISENLGDFEDNEETCQNGVPGCVNAPGVSDVIDGDIDRFPCFECSSGSNPL